MNRTSSGGSWAAVGGYMALIFILSATSFGSPIFQGAQKIHFDKIVHIVEYTFLGFLLARAWHYSAPGWSKARLWIAVLAVGVLYAATDEFHQSFVPTRDASVYDGMADTVGLALGCWGRLKKMKRPNNA